MKKILVLTAIFLTASIAGIIAVGFTVSAGNDEVVITERTLYGEKTAADGITIKSASHYDEHLRWDTIYTIGENAQAESEYSFSASRMRETPDLKYNGIMFDVAIHYGCEFNKSAEEQSGIARAYKELYDKAEPGIEEKKIIFLKDYYDYYPISLSFDLPGIIWTRNDYDALVEEHVGSEKYVLKVFNEFFRIPMLEHESLEIHVTRSSGNQGMSFGSSTVGSKETYFFDSVSAHTSDTCYFTISNRTTQGDTIDTSLIPGGYGIYSFNYSNGTTLYSGGSTPGVTGVDADSLSMTYKLDETVIVNDIMINSDNTKLLLFTYENDSVWLSVIDISVMQLMQKIKIEGIGQHYTRCDHGNFIVLLQSSVLAVIAENEDRLYEYKFTSPTANAVNENFQYSNSSSAMKFNDEKLVIVNSIYENQHHALNLCSFYVAVYDTGGLKYYGEYDSSLSINPDAYDYDYNCLPFGRDSYTLE